MMVFFFHRIKEIHIVASSEALCLLGVSEQIFIRNVLKLGLVLFFDIPTALLTSGSLMYPNPYQPALPASQFKSGLDLIDSLMFKPSQLDGQQPNLYENLLFLSYHESSLLVLVLIHCAC